MNKLFLIGNLTSDPISKTTQTGKHVCTFTVAVNRRSQNNEADFFRVNAWNGLADICAKYLSKGRKVSVVGSVSASAYKANNGDLRASLDVQAEDVEFITSSEKTQQNASESKPEQFTQVDEDLPF